MTSVTPRLRLAAVVCLLASGLLAAACSPNQDPDGPDGKSPAPSAGSIFEGGSVRIEVLKGLPGFSTRSGTEYEYAGFDIALSNYLANRMGFRDYPHDVPTGERETRLVDDDAELAVAAYTVTDGRDEKIDFTAPYFKTYQGVLVRKGSDDIKKVADLDGKRVCSAAGSTSDPDAVPKEKERRRLKNALGADATIGLRKDYKTCVQELRRGNFEAVWTDDILLQGFAQTPPYSKDVEVVKGITIENRQFYGIGIAEGHEDDCKRINKALRTFLGESWRDTFRDHFPALAESDPNFEQDYKPTDAEFTAYEEKSCGAA